MKIPRFLHSRATTSVALLVFCAACFAFVSTKHINSDSSIGGIIGMDIASGNLLLKDWFLSTQPYLIDYSLHGIFYFSTDSLQYTTYCTSVFLLFACLSAIAFTVRSITGKMHFAYVLPVYCIFVIAMRSTIFDSPVHYATVAAGLFSAYWYYRSDSAAIGQKAYLSHLWFMLFASLALASDAYAYVCLALPLMLEAAWHSLREKRLDRRIFLLPPAILAALATRWLLQKYGYELPGIHGRLADISALPANLALYISGWFELFSAWFLQEGISPLSRAVRLCFVPLALLCLAVHIRFARFPSRPVRFLCLSSLMVSAAFLFSNLPVDIYSGRYLLGVAANGAVLITVYVSGRCSDERAPAFARAIALALSTAFLIVCLVRPPSQDLRDAQTLVQALKEHNLLYGYAPYWTAYSTEFAANGAVRLAAVKRTADGPAPYYWLGKRDWYSRPATFVIQDARDAASPSDQELRAAFGEASERFTINERYTVSVWPSSLSPKLVQPRIVKGVCQ